ncbi:MULTISPECIES: NfeD family protein [unclassified Leptolyngbya]|uniref:NfeD family protein n=1 Tax=unclassified Leptolyngbya TaxID=2650499 RepID=UPI0018EFB370|nr:MULTISPECIES: NfeD family protein [unclassified Leptolyngbya]
MAILGGLDGADLADGHFEFEVPTDADSDRDLEFTDPGDRPSPSLFARAQRSSPLSLLTSFKFWTFGLCFFGLTGLVLTNLGLNPGVVAIVAVLMGLLCGSMMALTLRALRQRYASSLVETADLAGLEGTVEVPFDASTRGKVRVRVKGSVVDYIAYTNDQQPLERGDRILVIGTENNRLWVIPAESSAPDLSA